MFDRFGALISIAGIDGAGKTTLSRRICSALQKKQYNFEYIKTKLHATNSIFALAKRLCGDEFGYEELVDAQLREFTIACDVLEFSSTVLQPRLRSGQNLVWDRGPLCYQAYARAYGQEDELTTELHRMVEVPNLTVLLDVDVRTAVQRLHARVDQPHQTDESAEHLHRVRKEYLILAEVFPNVRVVNASKEARCVEEEATVIVADYLDNYFTED